MTLLVPWIAFPLLLTAIVVGCGLLLERLTAARLPRALVPPAGLAVAIVASELATASDATAELATPLVAGLAAAGFALAFPWRLRRLPTWPVVLALATFAVYAAPVVLSGSATFAGYIKLDDTATWFALTDRVMDHGRSLSGLAPSSYEATLAVNLSNGYPVGSLLPLGIGRALVHQDVAWVFQPYLAFLGALLALVVYVVVGGLVASRPLRALVAFLSAQSALLFGYSLWGGVKEIAAAPLIGLAAALLAASLRATAGWRVFLPLAVAVAAVVGVLSLAGGIWLCTGVVALVTMLVVSRRRTFALGTAALAVSATVLSIPSLLAASGFLRADNITSFKNGEELGNLIRPLSPLQLFGVWPTGDFRRIPGDPAAADVLIAVVAGGIVTCAFYAWRSRSLALPLYLFSAGIGYAVVASVGSPWVDAKALAMASPAFLAAGLAGAAVMVERGRRVEGGLALAAVTFGVLWSNVLAYHEVWLAPRGQLAELERIGTSFAGQGPALMTEYQPYGVRHFLRRLDAEGASELRRRLVPLRTGRILGKAQFADLDEFRLSAVLVYRTLVLRRSPVESRPPAPYRLIWHGRYYDVWQRSPMARPTVLAHVPAGSGVTPAGRPPCRAVRGLARTSHGGRLAFVERENPVVVHPGVTSFSVPKSGRYDIWVGGSFRRRLRIVLDGIVVGVRRHQLNNTAQYTLFGEVRLAGGMHRLRLDYGGSTVFPGSGGPDFGFGPIVVAPDEQLVVETARARSVKQLCRKTVDWVELLQGGS